MHTVDTIDLSYRLDKDANEIIRYTVVPASDRYDSVADFTRASINKHVAHLLDIAGGGRVAKKLIRRLTEIRGIQEEVPEVTAKARIGSTDLGPPKTVAVSKKRAGVLNDLAHETNLSKSEAIRYCVFHGLYHTAEQGLLEQEWEEREIIKTCGELKKGLVDPQMQLHIILKTRFQMHEPTRDFIQNDPQAFRDFAEVYANDFYETDSYEFHKEEFGRDTLSSVENMIEEYTDIEFNQQPSIKDYKTGFLADVELE